MEFGGLKFGLMWDGRNDDPPCLSLDHVRCSGLPLDRWIPFYKRSEEAQGAGEVNDNQKLYWRIYRHSIYLVVSIASIAAFLAMQFDLIQSEPVTKIAMAVFLIFTPYIIGYPFRFWMMSRNDLIQHGVIEHHYIGIDASFSTSVDYDIFGLFKPWFYIHGVCVSGYECGFYGIFHFVIFTSVSIVVLVR